MASGSVAFPKSGIYLKLHRNASRFSTQLRAFAHLSTSGETQVATPEGKRDWFNEHFVLPPEGFEEAMNRLMHRAMKQANQNVSVAARLLGVSRDYVRYRLSGQKSREGTRE